MRAMVSPHMVARLFEDRSSTLLWCIFLAGVQCLSLKGTGGYEIGSQVILVAVV